MIRDHAATIAQLISTGGDDFEIDIGDDEIHLIYTTYDGGRKVRTTLVVTDAVVDTESDWRSFD